MTKLWVSAYLTYLTLVAVLVWEPGCSSHDSDQPRFTHYHQTRAHSCRNATRCISSHLFAVCGCIMFLLWSALARFLSLINIILALKRLELNAFSAWIMEIKDTSTRTFPLRSDVDVLKSISWESSVRWTAKLNKRLFSWKRQSGDKLWTSHFTQVPLCRKEKDNQTQRMDLWGRVGRC